MGEKNEEFEEFNERFESIEQTLKYIAEAQAKAEFLHKKHQIESQKRWEQTQKQLDYITKLVGVSFEELDQMDERLFSASIPLGQRLGSNKSS